MVLEPTVTIESGSADALINAQDCLPDPRSLCGEQFDDLYFLNFCCGSEAAVIHPALHTVGSLDPNPVADRFLKERILEFHPIT